MWKSSLEGNSLVEIIEIFFFPLYQYLYSIIQNNITHCTDYQMFGLYFPKYACQTSLLPVVQQRKEESQLKDY